MSGRKAIAIGGFMGTGKTTVGRILANQLSWEFVDMDDELIKRYGSIEEQFTRHGETEFRKRETELLIELSSRQGCVVATGGGAWCEVANWAILDTEYITVVLKASWETVSRRIRSTQSRPLWNTDAQQLYLNRLASYRRGQIHIDTDNKTPEEVAEGIVQWMTKSGSM